VNHHTVLLIADDGAFPESLIAQWEHERIIPSFSVLDSDALIGPAAPPCDLAVVGPVRGGRLVPALKSLDASARPTLCLADASTIETLRANFPRVVFIPSGEDRVDCVSLLAAEMLRRVDSSNRARRAEQAVAKLEHEATLGRYVKDVRHGLNNALTSVLGNAELLLLDTSRYPEEVKDQLETIHTMSLRMHEMLYRISSLEHEMKCAQKQSQSETDSLTDAAAAGA
jgi:signal transduction histidine kinase